jgi:hypothetical protein
MICRIAGQSVPSTTVTYRELGFGQSVESPLHDYQIVYDREEFINLLADDYEELLADQKADDVATGEPSPKYFQELGYPSLGELIGHPDYLSDAITWLLWDDLLSSTFPPDSGAEKSWRWVINSIDGVDVQDGTIVVKGKVFARQPVFVAE